MLQPGCGLDFPEEPIDTNQFRQIAMHDFDRDLAIVAEVVREIHVRHAAGTDLPLDGVAVRQGRFETVERFHAMGQNMINRTPW